MACDIPLFPSSPRPPTTTPDPHTPGARRGVDEATELRAAVAASAAALMSSAEMPLWLIASPPRERGYSPLWTVYEAGWLCFGLHGWATTSSS